MNRNIAVGDVIRIGKSRTEYVAIAAGFREDGDWRSGCNYNFADLVVFNGHAGQQIAKSSKRIYTMCNGASYPITKLADITLVGTCTVKPLVAVEVTRYKEV